MVETTRTKLMPVMQLAGFDFDKTAAEFRQELHEFERLTAVPVHVIRQGLEHHLYGMPLHWKQRWPGSNPMISP
jgi:hypothetical protein